MVRSHVSRRADAIRPYGPLARMSRAKSLPPDVGKVARLAEPDEEYTRKSGTLFADELRSAHELASP